jgi:hypothetical protein
MADQTREDDGAGAEVVSLADIARDVRFPVLHTLETYWSEIRGTRLVPARADVDPRRIEDALEYAFILERIAPGMGRFRLAGMHLNDLMGMEVRGMPLTAFFAPEGRKAVSAALEQVFDTPAIARLTLSGERGVGRPPLDGRLLLLPLQSDFGDVSRALGCLATLGPAGRAPRRFTVTGADVEPLLTDAPAPRERRSTGWTPPPRSAGHGGHDTHTADHAGPHTGGPAEPPRDRHGAGAAPRPPRAEGRPHLYLVKSDDA